MSKPSRFLAKLKPRDEGDGVLVLDI